jgi:cytochrome c oxidase subunit 2
MWIVKVALNRPYTFIILALLILLLSPVLILRTPVDIFPNINIPVVAVSWTYTGLNPEEFEGRITLPYEKSLTTLVDNIQHIESTTYNGLDVVKIYLQPGASLDTANAQITAASQFLLKQLPPGAQPPQIINFSASSVPILQLGVSGKGLNEQQLNDYSLNFIRPQLITVPGAVIPSPYGGKQRQIMVNMDQRLMQAKGIAPSEVLGALTAQSMVLPSGTAKIGQSEYDVLNNVAPHTIDELNNIPIKQVDGAMIYMRDVATVSDGFQVQTNIVRQDGHRGVLVSVLKAGNASTLNVVKGMRAMLPGIATIVPPQLRMVPLSDQSVFVRAAVTGVIREAQSPTNIFDPAGTPAHSIFSLSMLVLSVTLGIFVVVAGLLLYALIRYRHRAKDFDREPAQVYGSNQIELSWTVIPILIVVMLFLPTTRIILGTQSIPKPASALNVTVIGHQFWWEYRYPKLGIVTANELHVPISDPDKPTPTYLEMSSADVAHSFWVPRLAGKMDLIPNRINTMWIDPAQPGLYLGQCAQYCGTQHAKMLLRIYAQSPQDFAVWVAQQKKPAQQDLTGNPAAQEGRSVFQHTACVNCHTVAGTIATGRFGPDLTHLASRDTLASGAVKNTPENLRKWIDDPNSMKPGALMPAMHLNDHDLDAITAYLTTLH